MDLASRLRAAANNAEVDVTWMEAPLDGEFSPVLKRRADAGVGWLTAEGEEVPTPLQVMSLGEFEPDVWLPPAHPAASGRVIGLDELAVMDVIYGPRRLSTVTYDAWLAIMRAANPRFEFNDAPFQRSLPMTLALAATAGRPIAVLTGPYRRVGDRPGPAGLDLAAGPADMVRARVDRSPLVAAAGLAWHGDLPRLLQQVLFDTADSIVFQVN